ncbi:Nif3-like dinuclear metal center hexameric protein [Patescibacteria group bacterium]|nr:Nif3-like dinuclear metal center hexameric protein [Patescibacteria group bacterium]
MNIQEIYKLAIKMGIENDLRGTKAVQKILKRAKEKYDVMSSEKKKEFDTERLTNPFADTRILYGDPKKEIKKVLVGVDIGPGEVLIAEKLGVDLIISHHPSGKALADLHDVMNLQAQVLADYGVPINVAESLMKERISEVARGVSAVNHQRSVDAVKLLKIPFMCIHTPADNCAATFLAKRLKREKPETLGELIKMLKDIEEYKIASQNNAGPKIWVGSDDTSAGKIVLTEITGGTEGAKGIYEKMSQAGIGTVVGMHMDEERKKNAQEAHINVVIAGHISSDSLGVNQILDELEKKRIEVITCSGLTRVSRVKTSTRRRRLDPYIHFTGLAEADKLKPKTKVKPKTKIKPKAKVKSKKKSTKKKRK